MAETSKKNPDKPVDESIKETFESIVIAFVLAFVFRAYVVEAFVIPTGSMAPTLLGAHVDVDCDQCGYDFPVGADEGRGLPSHAVCPMCRYANAFDGETRIGSGDRILVHKYVYSFSEPRRWDVVVFKAPHDPETNFIKRLIGLPNEQIYFFDGNVYVKPLDGDDWKIARKTDRPDVQRAVWQPLYHSSYIPLDGGVAGRTTRGAAWSTPWVADEPAAWEIEGRRSYAYAGRGDGRIHFDFVGARLGAPGVRYRYNQPDPAPPDEFVEDVRLAVTVQPQAAGVGVTLATSARLDEPSRDYGRQRLAAHLASDGTLTLQAVPPDGGPAQTLGREVVDPLRPDHNTRLELWYADQAAIVWVDGEPVLEWAYDLPSLDVLLRRERPEPPEVTITVDGGPAVLHDVQLDRDLFYASPPNDRGFGRGALFPRGEWEPIVLGPETFFCVGDNGPRSFDSRYWGPSSDPRSNSPTNPWIVEQMLQERVAAGLDVNGVVPRGLLMGRAFFVYFPAPYPFLRIPLPNFGDMRFIH